MQHHVRIKSFRCEAKKVLVESDCAGPASQQPNESPSDPVLLAILKASSERSYTRRGDAIEEPFSASYGSNPRAARQTILGSKPCIVLG
jgi:hypothetical protein